MSLSSKVIKNQKDRARHLGWRLDPSLLPDPPAEKADLKFVIKL
jgi:hypothetical protein